MKTMAISYFFLAFLTFGIQENQEPAVKPKQADSQTQDIEEKKSVDITERYKEIHNTDKFKSPPSEFRKGHVEPNKLDPKAIKKTKSGFEIQLPSNAPIPTITYYQDRIYASGGFHSKQFYCFDANSGEVVWGIDLDDDGPSAAVCENGVCVFNTESCTIFAVDSSTGEMLWSWWLGDPLMSTPTISNGRVFTSYPVNGGGGGGGYGQGGFGHVPNGGAQAQQTESLQQKNNQEETAEATDDEKASQKANEEQKDLKQPPGQTHALACFDLKTGKILWQRWLDSDIMSAPIADGGELFVTTFGGNVYKFKEASGEIISATQMRATTAPTIVKGKIVVSRRADDGKSGAFEALNLMDRDLRGYGGGQGGGLASKQLQKNKADYLDKSVQGGSKLAEKGKELDAGNGFGGGAPMSANTGAAYDNIGQQSVSTLQAYQGSRSLFAKNLNFNCPGNEIVCNDLEGNKKWAIKLEGDLREVGGMLAAPPIFAGNQVLVSTLSGHVLQLDPVKGKTLRKHDVGSPMRFPPIVHNGKIYVGTETGKVVCIDSGDKSLTGWTTWGGNSAHNKTD